MMPKGLFLQGRIQGAPAKGPSLSAGLNLHEDLKTYAARNLPADLNLHIARMRLTLKKGSAPETDRKLNVTEKGNPLPAEKRRTLLRVS